MSSIKKKVNLRILIDLDITKTKIQETKHWSEPDKLLAYLCNQILMNKKAVDVVDQKVTLTSP